MFAINIFLLTVTTAIIGLFFNYCHNRLRDFESELPKKVSYYFGNENWSTAKIIATLKKYITLNIEESWRKSFIEWLKQHNALIRDMLIVKIVLLIDIVFIIVFAVYNMLQIQ